LSAQKTELDVVIRKASELIHNHADDFEIPGSERTDSSTEEVYQLLITEWNNYQNTGSGMGNAVFFENLKPQTILPTDGHFLSHAVTKKTPGFNTVSEAANYQPRFESAQAY